MTESYKIVDHTYDVVVVGAGGCRPARRARLRASRPEAPPASPRSSPPARTPWRPKAASLRQPRQHVARTTGTGTCTTPLKGRIGWATRTPLNTWCRQAVPSVVELEHFGLPFSPHRRGQDLSAPVRRPHDGITARHRPSAARCRRG